MIRSALKKTGLDTKEISIYLRLLEMGVQPASMLSKRLNIPKSSVFDVLNKLEKMGIVSRQVKNGIHYFATSNPKNLISYLERKEHEVKSSKLEIENAMPSLIAMMNPYATRPKVETYEGWEGIKAVLDDTLNSKTEILSYVFVDGWVLNKELYEFARENNRKRCEKGIFEKGLVAKTKIAEKYYKTYSGKTEFCDFRWLPSSKHIIQNEISIYDDKISIASINPEDQLSIIIKSQKIADTQRAIFEAAWNGSEKFKVEIQKSSKNISRSQLIK